MTKSYLAFFLLLGIIFQKTTPAFCQESNVNPSNKKQIILELDLPAIFSESITLGAEVNYGTNYSLRMDLGLFNRKKNSDQFSPLIANGQGYFARLGTLYYLKKGLLNPKKHELSGFYLGTDILFQQFNYSYVWDNTQRMASKVYSGKIYELSFGLAAIAGRQFWLKNRIIVDIFGGIGLGYIYHRNFTNGEYSGHVINSEKSFITPIQTTEWNTKLSTIFEGGIKLGYILNANAIKK